MDQKIGESVYSAEKYAVECCISEEVNTDSMTTGVKRYELVYTKSARACSFTLILPHFLARELSMNYYVRFTSQKRKFLSFWINN